MSHLSIEIHPRERASVVAVHHAVGVQDGDDEHHEHLAQQLCLGRAPGEEVQHAFHHPRGGGLPRVHATGEEQTWL